jgi:pyruvate kinase
MLDTKGPEIRTGSLRDGKPIELVAGQELLIVTDYSIEGDAKRIACSYKGLPQSVAPGSLIYVADGSLTCEVIEIVDVNFIFLLIYREVLKLSAKTVAN